MTDPTEAADVASWWKRLKAAPADDVEKAKELCTSGKLKGAGYRNPYAVIALLDAVGPFLPPPGDTAARLLSVLCTCVHGAHVNNTNLEKLRDRCLDLLDLVLQLGHTDAFISTSRDSSELPERPWDYTRIMCRFNALLEEVIAYCNAYSREGMMAAASRFLPQYKHKETCDELVTELRDLTAMANLALGVERKLKDVNDKVIVAMPPVEEANSLELPAKPTEDASCVAPVKKERALKAHQPQPEQGRLREQLTSMEAELKKEMPLSNEMGNFSQHIHENSMQKLWSVYFKHEQAVRWGLWWAVFPAKLEGLPATSKKELVDLLASPEAQAAFKRAVEVEDSIFLSIDELRRSFPADQPLLERVKTLLQPPPPPPGGQKLPVRVRSGRAISPARLHRGAPVAPVPPQRPQSARQLPFGRHKVVHEVHGVAGPTRVPSEPVLGQRAPLAPYSRQPADASAGRGQKKLVDLLASPEAKSAFKRAVEDSIFLSIDELRRSFPADQPPLERVKTLLQSAPPPPRPSGQKPLRVGASCAGSPVQGGAQLFLSYRVPETGRKRHGGDRTVPLLKSALEAQGYSVFVGESDIEGGASWVQTIQVAITDCQVFIPVCSKTYGDTKWTLRELHAADEANKEILPIWHSGDYPPKPVSMYLGNVQRLPRGNQPLVQANFQSLVSDLVAAIKKAGCLPRNPPGPSNQALQGLALDQGRRRI